MAQRTITEMGQVRITATADKSLSVDREYSVILPEGRLTWLVGDLGGDGRSVEIDFHVYEAKKGPFPLGEERNNPVRGRYIGRSDDKIISKHADRRGYWKYEVVLRGPDDDDLASLDPGVMIIDGG